MSNEAQKRVRQKFTQAFSCLGISIRPKKTNRQKNFHYSLFFDTIIKYTKKKNKLKKKE